MKLNQTLLLSRCPHCQVANPSLPAQMPPLATKRADGQRPDIWAVFTCTSCGSMILAGCKDLQVRGYPEVVITDIYPKPKKVHQDIPPIAARFLQQSFETLHAPDAAAVMAGSAVDAMLKELGYQDGSVYSRINEADSDNILTKNMGQWAHAVRLGSNRPRHADADNPHVSADEAIQSVEFAEALAQFLFVLKAQVDRGIASARGNHPQAQLPPPEAVSPAPKPITPIRSSR